MRTRQGAAGSWTVVWDGFTAALAGLCLRRMLSLVAHVLDAVQGSACKYVGGAGITIKKS